MKKFVRILALWLVPWILLPPATAHAQLQSSSGSISVSGGTLSITNLYGAFNATFEEIPNGAPATVSITVQGCMRGQTCDSAADTNTATTASIRGVVFAKLYTSFLVTATWTGGTNVTITINPASSTARNSSGGGGGVTSIFSRAGVVVAANGDYTVAQVTGAAPIASPTFTGIPAAPTAAVDTSTTQLATTAYVVGQGYARNSITVAGHPLTANVVVVPSDISPSICGLVSANQASLSGSNTLSATANRATVWGYFNPIPCTTTQFDYTIATADNTANTYDLGVYKCTEPCSAATGNLLGHFAAAGTTFAAGTGIRTKQNWASSFILPAGRYYIALTSSCTVTCATLGGVNATGVSYATNQVVTVTTGGTLPATVTLPADTPSNAASLPSILFY